MEHFIELGLFASKVVLVFLLLVGVVALISGLIMRQKMRPELEIEHINQRLDDLEDMIQSVVLSKKDLKEYHKENKKREKDREREEKEHKLKHIYFLKFDGDIRALAVDELRDEITAVLTVAKPGDEAVISIESPGGTVHGYGLAAAQIIRLKNAGLQVTACVDRVAASGGYMMACTAHKILAAPFAIVGSIGVLAQVPNFNRFLKKHDVDYEEITSGEYKRTVSILGEITEKGRSKFTEQIVDTHALFKEFVHGERPRVDIHKVATGEYWYGIRAKELNLIDDVMTSDEYLLSQRRSAQIYSIKYHPKKSLGDKLTEVISATSERVLSRAVALLTERPQL